MNTDNLNEIRNLLGRYYKGECTHQERSRLAALLASELSLPADLEADRRLFELLEADAADLAEMPSETENRISAALEAEMAAGRKRRLPLRRVMLRVASVAACLLLALTGLWYFDIAKPGREAGSNPPTEAPSGVAELRVADTVLLALPTSTEMAVTEAPKAEKQGRLIASRRAVEAPRNSVKRAVSATPTDRDEVTEADEPEVDEWIAENYRVVDDPREADAIVSSVLAVMQNNIVFDEVKVASTFGKIGSAISTSY